MVRYIDAINKMTWKNSRVVLIRKQSAYLMAEDIIVYWFDHREGQIRTGFLGQAIPLYSTIRSVKCSSLCSCQNVSYHLNILHVFISPNQRILLVALTYLIFLNNKFYMLYDECHVWVIWPYYLYISTYSNRIDKAICSNKMKTE